ncbi:MAG: hypothetical protein KAH86_01435 [Methanosarcinales archaeon]|nr:hypothetical protein [Methanosarcinales archaeon]
MDYKIFELIIGVFTIIGGFLAISITVIAMKKLTTGHLKSYLSWIVIALLCFLADSVWHTAREWFGWKETYGVMVEYPEYFLSTLAYIFFIIAAYKVYKLAEIYGFKHEGDIINEMMSENNK